MTIWSKTPPTDAGWYWWRTEHGNQTPIAVHVWKGPGDNLFVGVVCVRNMTDGEWCLRRIPTAEALAGMSGLEMG